MKNSDRISSDIALIGNSLSRLENYCEKEDYKGYDIFDGLNSRLFKSSPLYKNSFLRLLWMQFFKRSIFNLRRIVLIPKDYNPKAMALFISGYCSLYKTKPSANYLEKLYHLLSILLDRRIAGYPYACWGYNFDWQARAFFAPKDTPNIIVTTFAAHALLDLYEISGHKEYLDISRSCCDFIINKLILDEDETSLCFAYIPGTKSHVHNANLLGAALLSRVFAFTKEPILEEKARKAVLFSVSCQQEDGSWAYGTDSYQKWIDNFHTGYNLKALQIYSRGTGDLQFRKNAERGYKFYKEHFFYKGYMPKFYHNRLYPIDIHSAAQSILTCMDFGDQDKDAIQRMLDVCVWTIRHFQSSRGYFYYRKGRRVSNRIAYMRWSQAWMFYALTKVLLFFHEQQGNLD
jgi:hypothetical protein